MSTNKTKRPRPYVLSETNWKDLKTQDFTVAVLPWGATEAHNYHLPYGTDHYLAEKVAISSAGKAWKQGARVIVLPTIPFGVNTGQIAIPLCMNMNPSTQYAVLKDTVQVLAHHNIKKLVIVNAHGGNNFKHMVRELGLEFPSVFCCAVNWWQSVKAESFFEEPGDHAGELETATMLFLKPELVLPPEHWGQGKSKSFKIKGLKEGWVSAQRQWHKVSEDTGVGNPKMATKDKGEKFFNAVTTQIASFLEEIHSADLNDMYE
ncbi:creatininase family protein [Aestuariivivens sediminicola]|uniref:creatininase family protein n=1 Tax=Aestuariivivens sediminicola TaxID=2913560 RepID=UPI001F57BC45|nr:creatininase family protein [Aestuariivivens sediminicola]